MVLSPLGDVDQRRQTVVLTGRVILRSSKGMWMRQMNTPTGFKTEVGRPCVLYSQALQLQRRRMIATRPSASTIASPAYRRARRRSTQWRRWSRAATRSAPRSSRPQAPSFYNVTLKNMAVPWTNRDQSVFVPLNDYVATFIGMVRDDVAVQHRAVCRPDLHREWRDAGGFGHQQRALRERRDQLGQPVRRAAADHAVVGARHSRPRPPRAS